LGPVKKIIQNIKKLKKLLGNVQKMLNPGEMGAMAGNSLFTAAGSDDFDHFLMISGNFV
jgi:hypothetical protein